MRLSLAHLRFLQRPEKQTASFEQALPPLTEPAGTWAPLQILTASITRKKKGKLYNKNNNSCKMQLLTELIESAAFSGILIIIL